MKKGEKHLKLCSLDCVDPLWFGCLVQSTWKMMITNDLCEVHKRFRRISLGMNPKQCSDSSEWSEHKTRMNSI